MGPKPELLERYRQAVKRHDGLLGDLKNLRAKEADSTAALEKSEYLISILHSTGQQMAEVLHPIDDDNIIVRSAAGPRYLVNKRKAIKLAMLAPGTRVSLALNTSTVMHVLPPQTDPAIFKMTEMTDTIDGSAGGDGAAPPRVTFESIGGLSKELTLIKEAIQLPIQNPEIFRKVGVKAPKCILLAGPPGTGKSLICMALANSLSISFIKVVGSSLINKYIGESSRMVREMFAYARSRSPCLIMIDEIDSIGSKRQTGSNPSDREVSRCMLQLLTEIDGFSELDAGIKIIFCTNRPDSLDDALTRQGRIDVKIEIKLPDASGRYEILKIHSKNVRLNKDCDFSAIVKNTDGFNGADLRNVITEGGLHAIRDDRAEISMADLLEGARIVRKGKTMESRTHEYTMKGFNED